MNDTIRQAYQKAKESRRATDHLAALLKEEEAQALTWAYEGAVEALKAKFEWMPFNRLAYLAKAQELFKKAVQADPEDLEIRFLRYSIQSSLPSLLMQSYHLKEDRQKIIEQLPESTLNPAFLQAIAAFVRDSGDCSKAEKQALESFLEGL